MSWLYSHSVGLLPPSADFAAASKTRPRACVSASTACGDIGEPFFPKCSGNGTRNGGCRSIPCHRCTSFARNDAHCDFVNFLSVCASPALAWNTSYFTAFACRDVFLPTRHDFRHAADPVNSSPKRGIPNAAQGAAPPAPRNNHAVSRANSRVLKRSIVRDFQNENLSIRQRSERPSPHDHANH